jgi:hypothetical protein
VPGRGVVSLLGETIRPPRCPARGILLAILGDCAGKHCTQTHTPAAIPDERNNLHPSPAFPKGMPETANHTIQWVDRTQTDVIIAFRDGRSARYSSALLYSILPQAQEIPVESPEEEPS